MPTVDHNPPLLSIGGFSDILLGDALSHADIAVAVVVHFLRQGAPGVLEGLELPSLSAHADAAHELAPFQAIDEPLNFPA